MFRPRLTEPEIKFLLSILEPKKEETEILYRNSLEKLTTERDEILTFLKKFDKMASAEFVEQKRQRLASVQNEMDSNWTQTVLYQGLCVRFQDLLGHKKRGRLKLESSYARTFLKKELEPEHKEPQTMENSKADTEQSMYESFIERTDSHV